MVSQVFVGGRKCRVRPPLAGGGGVGGEIGTRTLAVNLAQHCKDWLGEGRGAR